MERASTPEGHAGKIARVIALLDGDEGDAPRYLRIGPTDDGLGRRHHVEAEGTRHMAFDGVASGLHIDPLQLTANGTLGIDAPHDHIRVRDSRMLVAKPIA